MLRSSFSACRLIISMVFSSIYTLVLTLTCSPPCHRCSVQPIAVAAHSLRCHASPLLVYALFCFAYALHNYAFAILFYAKLCRCVPLLFPAFAHHRHSMPPQFNAILCRCDSLRRFAFAFVLHFCSARSLPCHCISCRLVASLCLCYALAIRITALQFRCVSIPCRTIPRHRLSLRFISMP